MHIAICDDHIADRKQMERLLSRESDRRIKTTGNLYIDSFGSVSALLHAPMIYNLFFIDYHSDSLNGMDVALRLRKAGVTAPIVLCSGITDYTTLPDAPDNILHISKPIQVKALTDMITTGLQIQSQSKPPIPIQGESETFYLKEEEFLYAHAAPPLLYVYASSGKTISTIGKISDLAATLENNISFYQLNAHTIVNLHHIADIRSGSLTLCNKARLRFPFWITKKLRICQHLAKQKTDVR